MGILLRGFWSCTTLKGKRVDGLLRICTGYAFVAHCSHPAFCSSHVQSSLYTFDKGHTILYMYVHLCENLCERCCACWLASLSTCQTQSTVEFLLVKFCMLDALAFMSSVTGMPRIESAESNEACTLIFYFQYKGNRWANGYLFILV